MNAKVTVGLSATMLLAIIGTIYGYGELNADVENNTEYSKENREFIKRIVDKSDKQFDKLHDKIDKLIEYEMNKAR